MYEEVIYESIDSGERYKHCRNEQQFKIDWLRNNQDDWKRLFPIETEETIQGFPDVLAFGKDGGAVLLEFKFCDKHGAFQFQPTQPAFYRKHSDIPIYIVVLYKGVDGDPPLSVKFFAQRLFDNKLLNVRGRAYIDEVITVLKDDWSNEE